MKTVIGWVIVVVIVAVIAASTVRGRVYTNKAKEIFDQGVGVSAEDMARAKAEKEQEERISQTEKTVADIEANRLELARASEKDSQARYRAEARKEQLTQDKKDAERDLNRVRAQLQTLVPILEKLDTNSKEPIKIGFEERTPIQVMHQSNALRQQKRILEERFKGLVETESSLANEAIRHQNEQAANQQAAEKLDFSIVELRRNLERQKEALQVATNCGGLSMEKRRAEVLKKAAEALADSRGFSRAADEQAQKELVTTPISFMDPKSLATEIKEELK